MLRRPGLLAALLALAACGGTDDPGGDTIALHLTATAGVGFPTPAKVVVSVYGCDTGAADAPADEAYTAVLDIRTLPATVQVVLPGDLAASVDQGFGPPPAERARFALYVRVDTDADGYICPGDLREILDSDGGVQWGADLGPPPASAELQVGPVDSRQPCEPAVPE